MPDRRPIEDLDMLHQRPTCLMETRRRPQHAKSETDMPDQRPIEDQHAPLVTDFPHRRLSCLIRDPSETSTCFIGDPSKTDMPHRRPIWNRHAPSDTHRRQTCLLVSDEACQGLRSGMSVSGGSPIRYVGLQWVSDEACRDLWWIFDNNNFFVNSKNCFYTTNQIF